VIEYSGPCCPEPLFGLGALIVGFLLCWSSWRLWRHPDSLKPSSLAYRNLQASLRIAPWRWKEKKPYAPLTDGQIRFFAAVDLVMSFMLVLSAIWMMFGKVLWLDW
jgi:hypothetical protein